MLPYASDHRPSQPPVITWTLLGVTTLLSAWLMLADRIAGPGRSAEMLSAVGLTPIRFHPLTLFTYVFFHIGVAHLVDFHEDVLDDVLGVRGLTQDAPGRGINHRPMLAHDPVPVLATSPVGHRFGSPVPAWADRLF